MHYYQFNIGDYKSHTSHLDPLEDIAYRRMLDFCYLNEIGLPNSIDEIGRLISMRTHSECIANALREFFFLHSDGTFRSKRVEKEIEAYKEKSGKASEAAKKRWGLAHANALPSHSERIANHKPITNNQEPLTKVISGKPPKQSLDYSCWPDMPSDQVLNDWIAMRKRLKADISQTVINQFGKELQLAVDAGFTVDQCLSECVASGWRGFKFGWVKNREASNEINQRTARQTRGERNEQAFRDYLAELEQQEGIDSEMLAGVIEPPPS